MDISVALAADLAALSDALGDPAVDLEARLRAVAADLAHAVASFAGLTMTIVLDGQRVSFSTADGEDTAAAGTSLEIPLSVLTAAQDGSSLVFYAAAPGAFVDLAADLSHVLGIDPELLVLDRHRDSAAEHRGAGIAGLAELSVVNQAIGVLIARGHTPEGARAELRRLADLDGGRLHSAAGVVLGSLAAHPGTDQGLAEGRDDDPRR